MESNWTLIERAGNRKKGQAPLQRGWVCRKTLILQLLEPLRDLFKVEARKVVWC